MVLRPFLKWVGGKRQLLPVLRRFYPAHIGRYFEPFVGSAAVFFDLLNQRLVNGDGAMLSDANADLIGSYRRIADSLDQVLATLDRYNVDHFSRWTECYLEVRDRQFNPMRATWRANGANLDDYTPEMAAMMIYLNRTGYNGLFRINKRGIYNVPPGRYDKPRICNRVLLTRISNAFTLPAVRLEHGAYDRLLSAARPGDFVYLDPPYAPLSATANFNRYTGTGFSLHDQHRLQQLAVELSSRRVNVLLSNSVAPEICALYENNDAATAAGLKAWRFPARRSINSRPDRRGLIEELIVSNVPPRDAWAMSAMQFARGET